jgi:hypothetical protein
MRSSHNLALAHQSPLDALTEFLEQRKSAPRVADLEAFERDLRQMVAAVEREALEVELAKFDVDVPELYVEGVRHRQVLRCEQTYLSAAGEVKVMRSLYSSRQEGERAVCPMEIRAGIVEKYWTPLAAKHAIWAVSHLTPQESESLFGMLGGMTPSKSSLDRLPKAIGEHWELERRRFEETLRAEAEIPGAAATLAVSIDGVLVPMKDGKRAEKRERALAEGKETRGPAGYQEASCGTVSFLDPQAERLETWRWARMPEPKKATLKEILSAEVAASLEARPDLRLVKLADGAKDNWTYFATLTPGIEVVDFFHAAEHLKKALDLAYGEGSAKSRSQFEKLRHVLRHDKNGVAKVIRALIHLRDQHPRSKKIPTELKYFRKNRHRMRYAQFVDDGIPIGSGVVEAACKTLVTQRLKRSGMRWHLDGGQAILTFRSLVQSGSFERGWRLVADHYKQTVTLPEKVAAFPKGGSC